MQHKLACLFRSTIHCAGGGERQAIAYSELLRRQKAQSNDCVCDGADENREIAMAPDRGAVGRLLAGGALCLVACSYSHWSIDSHGATSARNHRVIRSSRQ